MKKLNEQTYASQLLIVINPFCNVPELYGREQMKRYQGENKECQHIYAMGLFNNNPHLIALPNKMIICLCLFVFV